MNVDMKKQIFNELTAEITVDAIQRKSFGDKAEGYNIGYLIERLNDVLVPKGWSWDAEIMPINTDEGNRTYILDNPVSKDSASKIKPTVAVRIKVSIKNEEDKVVWVKESFGGCQLLNNSLGDTLKGAQTDAMKKCFSYLGIGNEAYKGRINDQVRHLEWRRGYIIQAIKDALSEKYKREIDGELALRYINSVTEKIYCNIEEVRYYDWELVLESLGPEYAKKAPKPMDTKEKPASEQKRRNGSNKVPASSEEVDNSESI